MYIVNMDKAQAEQAYLNKSFRYELSPSHVLAVTVEAVKVYGGVVLCMLKVNKVLKTWKGGKDKTNYKALAKEFVLAGRLSPV